jgi:hypothetical protein
MTNEQKDKLLKVLLIYLSVFSIMSVVSGILKVASAIHHQVILKDQ